MATKQMFPEESTFMIKNDLYEIKAVHQFLAETIKKHNINGRTLFHLQLTCEELITNTIKYGFTDDKEHSLQICCRIESDRIILKLRDNGLPFNPLQHSEPDTRLPLEKRPIGGLGIYFAKRLMDKLEYQRKGDYNVLLLTKNIKRRERHGD